MFTFLMLLGFFWLFIKGLGLMLRITWSFAKVVSGILLFLALPALGLCVLLASGIALLVPLALVGIAPKAPTPWKRRCCCA